MKIAWYSKKWVIVLLHIAVWILFFSLPFLLSSPSRNNEPAHADPKVSAHNIIFRYVMNLSWVIFFYLNAYFLIPKFINKKKYGLYALFLGLAFAWLMIQGWIFFHDILFGFFVFLFFLASSTAFQMIRDKLRNDKLAKEKENANLKTELSLLRSQASPHFMFNVLNNMVSLARKQSDQLEPSLIKLSSLMRYMLYDADEEKVSLEKEIDYLHSYIDLQQQRFGKKIKLQVNLDVVDDQYQVEPMLLIPFVENAFKHGTGMIEDARIDIELRAEKNILQFTVRNKYNHATEEVKDQTSGIGLTNVKRRLNLLYGNKHTLLINQNDNWFIASLQIYLN